MGVVSEYQDASSSVSLIECDVGTAWIGQDVARVEQLTSTRVAYLTRLGRGLIPVARTIVQENDVVHLMVATERIGAVQRVLVAPPAKEV